MTVYLLIGAGCGLVFTMLTMLRVIFVGPASRGIVLMNLGTQIVLWLMVIRLWYMQL